MVRDAEKLVARAGVPPGATGDGSLAGEPVLVLRGAWFGNLEIFNRKGRPIGKVAHPDGLFAYTFSDSEDRFELRGPLKGRPGRRERRENPDASRDPDRAFTLQSTGGSALARVNTMERIIDRDGEMVARFARCSIGERVDRVPPFSGVAQWRVLSPDETELARITFLRWRNLRYAVNATVVLGAMKDRVNYVVAISPVADPVERAVAIALTAIIDTHYVSFIHAGED